MTLTEAKHRRASAEDVARRFHETYERLAPEFDYDTRRESAVPWEKVPETNRRLMVAVVEELFLYGGLSYDPQSVYEKAKGKPMKPRVEKALARGQRISRQPWQAWNRHGRYLGVFRTQKEAKVASETDTRLQGQRG